MDAKLKTLWMEALRSGEYVQGTGYLKSAGAHCCLGVLCEVAVANDMVPEGVRVIITDFGITNNSISPAGGRRALGTKTLQSPWSWGLTRSQIISLMIYNDSSIPEGGKDFHGIADWIEENVSSKIT